MLDNLQRIGRVRPERVLAPLQGPVWAYRRRARLGVKYVHKKGRVLAGFREREKPYIADLQHCEVLLQPLADLPRKLAALVETLAIREKLPQVEVAAGDSATALVLRVLEQPGAADLEKIAAFGASLGVQIFLQSGGLDTVRPLLAAQAPPLSYAVDAGHVHIEFGPVDFIQVNRDINVSMVSAALELLQPAPQDSVLDLFCGLGNFTLPMARRSLQRGGRGGRCGAHRQGAGQCRAQRHWQCGVLHGESIRTGAVRAMGEERYDLVLLDPPRAGAIELLPRMAHWRPRRVVYISCHPGSLARDAEILVHTLGFKLTCAGVMDMFPHTTHVESIAVFEGPA